SRAGFWLLVIVGSVFADIDVIGFRMGVPYGALWGHRGIVHSLLFAAAFACTSFLVLRNRDQQWQWSLIAVLFLVAASHGILDALTDGGLGVAFFSPFDRNRYFFPWRPIHVSPIGVHRLLSDRMVRVLTSEIVWVWLPAFVFIASLHASRI